MTTEAARLSTAARWFVLLELGLLVLMLPLVLSTLMVLLPYVVWLLLSWLDHRHQEKHSSCCES